MRKHKRVYFTNTHTQTHKDRTKENYAKNAWRVDADALHVIESVGKSQVDAERSRTKEVESSTRKVIDG